VRTYANVGSASATSLLVDMLRQRDDLDQAIAVLNRAPHRRDTTTPVAGLQVGLWVVGKGW
jgi:hypothetical protein